MPRRRAICGRIILTAFSKNIFELQDRVTSSVVGAIAPKLEQGRDPPSQTQAGRKPRCLRLLLRGLARIVETTKDAEVEARHFFENAVKMISAHRWPPVVASMSWPLMRSGLPLAPRCLQAHSGHRVSTNLPDVDRLAL